jgi:cytidyltransferase-like protein
MVVVITSGGFDPLHVGHIEYLTSVKRVTKANLHICIVNNDEFLMRKKGYAFMKMSERARIVRFIKGVDYVWYSSDRDDTVCESLRQIREMFPAAKLVFAKGGDRDSSNSPEYSLCKELNISFMDGIGKKIQSSSELVEHVMEVQHG